VITNINTEKDIEKIKGLAKGLDRDLCLGRVL